MLLAAAGSAAAASRRLYAAAGSSSCAPCPRLTAHGKATSERGSAQARAVDPCTPAALMSTQQSADGTSR